MTEFRPISTLSDAVLVRHLDGCASADEEAAVAAMDPSGGDALRLGELAEASDLFMDLLTELGIPETPCPRPAPPASGRRALKAAGIALLLSAGGVAAMPGGRAAAVEMATSLVRSVLGDHSAVAADGATVTVAVGVVGDAFSVRIDHRQPSGVLTLRRHQRADVEVVAPSEAEVVVLPGGVVIRNANAEGDLTVRTPDSVTSLRVTIAEDEREIVLTEDDPMVVIDLRPPGR